MTAAERVIDLFLHRPSEGLVLDWLASNILNVAAEEPSLTMRLVPAPDGPGWLFEVGDGVGVATSPDSAPRRLFRPLLARFAAMAQEETGAEFSPYGGRIHFDRSTPAGTVRIETEFSNSQRGLWATMTPTPLQAAPRPQPANGAIAPSAPVEPTGA